MRVQIYLLCLIINGEECYTLYQNNFHAPS